MANKKLRALVFPRSAKRLHDQALWSEALILRKFVKEGHLPSVLLSREEQERGVEIPKREKQAACSAVQWLGSNCGRWFMQEAERMRQPSAILDKFKKEGYLRVLLSQEELNRGMKVLERDRRPAYAVIRWLGTDAGRRFMKEATEKIKKVRERECERKREADRKWLESLPRKAA